MARTGGEGPRGISCIVVEKDTPGLSFGAPEKKLGWKSQPTAMVLFDDCRVPVANRVGEEGQGFRIAMAGLDGGRLNIAACSIGGAQFCLDRTIEYMRERKQFGTRLADFQALAFRVADYATDLQAARLMVHHAASAVTNRTPGATRLAAQAKRFAANALTGTARAAPTDSAFRNVCFLTPQSIEGPYYLDPQLVRARIAEGRAGVPLRVDLRVIDGATCKPSERARVDLWHADAQGIYSGYEGQGDKQDLSTVGQKFLRGTQFTDRAGRVRFETIYPGWYEGRATHIHFKVLVDERNVLTGQMY